MFGRFNANEWKAASETKETPMSDVSEQERERDSEQVKDTRVAVALFHP